MFLLLYCVMGALIGIIGSLVAIDIIEKRKVDAYYANLFEKIEGFNKQLGEIHGKLKQL